MVKTGVQEEETMIVILIVAAEAALTSLTTRMIAVITEVAVAEGADDMTITVTMKAAPHRLKEIIAVADVAVVIETDLAHLLRIAIEISMIKGVTFQGRAPDHVLVPLIVRGEIETLAALLVNPALITM